MLNNESWDTLSQSFEFEPRAHFVETLFVACSDYAVDDGYISFRFALADRVRIQTAVDSIVAAQVPFYFTMNKDCSTPSVIVLSMSSGSQISSFSFTLASLILAVPLGRSRRGGRRKGKPRPKVKNIIIGGRHL